MLERTSIEQDIVIAGIPIPSSDPWFLATVGYTWLQVWQQWWPALLRVLSRKGDGRHPRFASIYVWALLVIASTMTALTVARWPANNHLAVLGILSLGSAMLLAQLKPEPLDGIHFPFETAK